MRHDNTVLVCHMSDSFVWILLLSWICRLNETERGCCRVWQSGRSSWPCGISNRHSFFIKDTTYSSAFSLIKPACENEIIIIPKRIQNKFLQNEFNYFCSFRIPQKTKTDIFKTRFWQSQFAKKIKNNRGPDEKWRITITDERVLPTARRNWKFETWNWSFNGAVRTSKSPYLPAKRAKG